MDELLEQLVTDPWGRLTLHFLLTGGLWDVSLFLLVISRFTGLFLIAPLFGHTGIPIPARLTLVVLFSLIVAPTLASTSIENPVVTQMAHSTSNQSVPVGFPRDTVALIAGIASELGLGTLFGVGAIAVISGLRVGGEWLDRHSGLGLGSVMNPEWTGGTSACGSMAQILGIAALLLAEPLGGHWQLIQTVMQSFHAIPIGTATWSTSWTDLLNQTIQQSFILGIRVAMPVVTIMLLIDLTMSLASRGATTSEASWQQLLRLGTGLFVLAVTVTSIPESVAQAVISAGQTLSEFRLH